MAYLSPYIEHNPNELSKLAKKYLANPEGVEKALIDIEMRAKEIDYRRHTYQTYGLARPEGYNAYTKMHKEIERLRELVNSLLK